MAVAKTRRRASPPRRRVALQPTTSRPLFRGFDHGDPITVRSEQVGAGKQNPRWTEPFLAANRASLRRLALRPEVVYEGELVVRLHPEARVGAAALLAPGSRKVTAGILIKPRFSWTHMGDVVGRIGFAVEPRVGGGQLVPGSAREVPAWLLAGPVLGRLAAIIRRRRRVFVPRRDVRTSPRGRVDWAAYARHSIGTGRWHHLPCTFSEPEDDPALMAMIRWTLGQVRDSLVPLAPSAIGQALITQAGELLAEIGPGLSRRPDVALEGVAPSEWLSAAFEAMYWVSEERGLGGAQTLDGLAWDLAVDAVWEHWVAHNAEQLAPRLGMTAFPRGQTRHTLRWSPGLQSMRALVPDAGMHRADHVVWIDAKYKSHLLLLARKGWGGLAEDVRDAHRADLHQALAYASLAGVDTVDTVLAYPMSTEEEARPPIAIASVASGGRRVRLILAGLPFGYRSPAHREQALGRWRELLAVG